MINLILTLSLLSIFPLAALANIDKQDLSLYQVSKANSKLEKLAELFEVESVGEKSLNFYVPPFKNKNFLTLAPQAKLLKADIYEEIDQFLKQKESNGYRNWDEVQATLARLEKEYPELVKLGTYGTTLKGEKLYYLKVSDDVKVDEGEPELMITAATHGDELITTEVLLRLIEEMLLSSKTDIRLKRMIEEHELYFIPVVNPDGFKRARRYTSDGTDPNRDYPYPKNPNKKSVKCIEDEIQFFHSRNFVGSIDLHASGKLIMYPWAYTKDPVVTADQARFEELGQKMANENNYSVGQISKIIYVAPASSADYFYWKTSSLSYGIELANTKIPRGGAIDKVVDETRSLLWNFIESF